MSNSVEFAGVEDIPMVVPAMMPVVFLYGRICECFEVVEIVQEGMDRFGHCRLRYNPALFPIGKSSVRGKRIETIAPMGAGVRICQIFNAGIGKTQVESLCIFSGYVEGIERKVDSGGEIVEAIARDMSARLDRIVVNGRRVYVDAESTLWIGSETVFNKDNRGNSSAEIMREGKVYRVFSTEQMEANLWTCAEIVRYLLSEYLPYGTAGVPVIDELEAMFGGLVADEIDVEGASLLDALIEVCEFAGVEFGFIPDDSEAGPCDRIEFYRTGSGRAVELNCQKAGEVFDLCRTNIVKLQSEKAYWPVTHRFVGKGAVKVFEGTFGLVKAWDTGGEGKARTEYSPSTSMDFEAVRDVYRRWCLNEAGDYTGVVHDFTKVFGTDEYLRRHRRFGRALSIDGQGQSLGYYVEISYNTGVDWQEYTGTFDVFDDECGIWLSGDDPGDEWWNAAVAGTLQFRITATIESDERLRISISNGPVESTVPVVDHVLDVDQRFAFRKVSGQSIFYDTDGADEIDDTEALCGYVRRLCANHIDIIERIEITTPLIATHYRVGDRIVTSPDSADILGVRDDSRSVYWIDGITVNFEKQETKLVTLRSRNIGRL